MKSKLFLITLAVAFLCVVQPAKAQGKGYYKHHNKEYKHQRDYGYRHDRGDDDDQGGQYHYYRGNNYGYYRNNLPPGQAKKIYGYKSAKYFAPGQRKKRYQYYDERYDNRYYYNQGYRRPGVLVNILASFGN